MHGLVSSRSSIPAASGIPSRWRAESLYEAAALAVQEFRRHPWTDGIEPGTLTQLEVTIKAPMTTHSVSIWQLEKWIARSAKSPHDTMLKARVRALLDPKSDAGDAGCGRG